jgi:hypothetical protein
MDGKGHDPGCPLYFAQPKEKGDEARLAEKLLSSAVPQFNCACPHCKALAWKHKAHVLWVERGCAEED